MAGPAGARAEAGRRHVGLRAPRRPILAAKRMGVPAGAAMCQAAAGQSGSDGGGRGCDTRGAELAVWRASLKVCLKRRQTCCPIALGTRASGGGAGKPAGAPALGERERERADKLINLFATSHRLEAGGQRRQLVARTARRAGPSSSQQPNARPVGGLLWARMPALVVAARRWRQANKRNAQLGGDGQLPVA